MNALGWTLAAGTALVAQYISRLHSLRGLWGAVIYLGGVAVDGLILGSVTGACLGMDLPDTNPRPDNSMKPLKPANLTYDLFVTVQ